MSIHRGGRSLSEWLFYTVLVCSLVRMIAYNLLVTLLEVHGKAEHWHTRTWQGFAGLMFVFITLASMATERGFQGV